MELNDRNLKWHPRKVTLEDIEQRNLHKGCVLWYSGLSASGKSTIAVDLELSLFKSGYNVVLLDGDNIRKDLNKDLGFSQDDRNENIRRIAEIAKLFQKQGFIVISAFISPYKSDREFARSLIDPSRFFEVFIKCSIEECQRRDPKGFYKKAIKGEIKDFTGISAPFEEPDSPELILDTEILSVEQSVEESINKLKIHGII